MFGVSALFLLHFIGQYLASQNMLQGLDSLHRTIQTTGEVRQLRELLSAQEEFLKKPALSDDEEIVFNNYQKQTDEIFAVCLELSAFRPEAFNLIKSARAALDPLKEKSRQILDGEGDVLGNRLIAGQYVLEIQDLLGKVQLVLAADSDRIVNGVYGSRFVPLTVGVVLSLISVAFAIWMGADLRSRIEVPIQHLVEATKVLAGGNLQVRAPVSTADELGLLGHAFNSMAERLEDSTVSKAYVENILESMLNCVLVLAPEGRILSVNRLTVTTFGYSREELVGSSISEILVGAFPLAGTDVNTETTGLAKNGHEFPVFVSVSSLDEQGGASRGLRVCTIKDVTENKKFENAIRERNLALSVANQELEAFSYSVSHDLRAPLRIIDGFSQALLEDAGDKLDDANKNHLDRIRQGVQRMGHLIDAVLNLSRISRASMSFSKVDLSAIVHDVAAELKKQNPESPAEFRIQGGLSVEGDPVLLKITMENLVGNAFKYSSKKEKPLIEFGMRNHEKVPTYFVRDNGAGFDMNYAQKLFMPFQRLHTQTDFAGTGVGLASVKRVIHRHGGNIWAESRVGEGTTFYFTLQEV